MRLEKIGTSFLRNSVSIWSKSNGSILRTKPVVFHGINPTATYPSGKTFSLPRFISKEMKQARMMNKIAISELKHPKKFTYPKASPEDFQRLTSNTVEASYSRVQWTNPKDSKIYNLLKLGKTEDGKVLVRILNSEGEFIKETTLKPKKIAIIDLFRFIQSADKFPELEKRPLEHGEYISIFARRNNPFAEYTFIDLYNSKKKCCTELNLLYEIANASKKLDKKYDFLSISLGVEAPVGKAKLPSEQLKFIEQDAINNEFTDYLINTSKNTRVLVAAGNEGKNFLTTTLKGNVEGVGALSKKGIITEYSASRNSYFTQHYELGDFERKIVKDTNGQVVGINITGLSGSDLKIKYSKELTPEEIEEISELKAQLELLTKKRTLILRDDGYTKEYWQIGEKIYPIEKELNELIKDTKIAVQNDLHNIEEEIIGTSIATPIRVAKIALNEMMEGIL